MNVSPTLQATWLTTERLVLRRFTPADLDWLAELSWFERDAADWQAERGCT